MPVEQGQPLSERELEIITLVAEGLTNREVAVRLFLSPNTVKVHLRNIFTKTGVSSRTELSMLAVQEGWVEFENQDEDSEQHAQLMSDTTDSGSADDMDTPIPPWSWQRWTVLGFSTLVIVAIMILPALRSQQAASLGPGQIFGPAQDTLGMQQANGQGRWVEHAALPVRRAGMGVTSLGGKAYIIGGINAEGTTGRVDIYDIKSNQWSAGQPRPASLGNVAAGTLNGNIFVPGGCDANWIPQDVVHQYNPVSDSWSDAASLPIPLCAYALAIYHDKLFLIGGWNGETYTAASYVYDPGDDTWQSMASPTVARGFGAAAVLSDRIFYIGGYDGRRELDTCEVYNPAEDEWTVCPSMLQPRGGIAVAVTAGRLYVLGGGWDSFFAFNERFSPESGQWTVMDTPIVGEWRNVGAFVSERSLYVVGGWSGVDFLNRLYAVEVMPWRVFMPGTFRTP
jgi:DNA-binding CsgD family transcriptional regulator/N-acetylneuraminic acid mutarotase